MFPNEGFEFNKFENFDLSFGNAQDGESAEPFRV